MTSDLASWLRHRLRYRVRTGQAGATLTELAIVIVLFLFLIFSIIEAGRLIWDYNVVANAAREGVRYAIVRGGKSPSPATATDVKNFVRNNAVGINVDPNDITVQWPTGNLPGNVVRIQVQYTFVPVTLPPSWAGPIVLRARSEMVISR